METLTAKIFSFGEFELDAAKRRLSKRGEPISLNSKAFDLLLALVEHHGQVLSKDALLEKVWAGQFVEENNLTVHISALRKIFGEKKGENSFIVTIPGRGYSFVAELKAAQTSVENESDPPAWTAAAAAGEKPVPQILAPDFSTVAENLIGRTREIAEIKNLLRGDETKLVTLTGTGGVGKTSLARAVAAELTADFADGVFFVELASVAASALVASTVAQALGVKETGEKPIADVLQSYLRERRMLLVLDNFEHLLAGAAPVIREFLRTSENLRLLITSRIALRLKQEREFVVAPLFVPPREPEFSAAELGKYPAVALFAESARNIKPSFELTDENALTVAEICRRLDGLPLAIELAAARVKLLSPAAILERLENSLKLLTSPVKDAPSRQRTMRETIKWSYDLLAPEEQNLLRQLAVFAGGFTVEAAEAVGGRSDILTENAFNDKDLKTTADRQPPIASCPPPPVLDLLTSLVEKNLLAQKEQTGGDVRLQLLEVIREFAFECLESSGELAAARRKHAWYFLGLAEKAEPHLVGEDSAAWLDKLEAENDNLRAALNESLPNDIDAAARLTAALRYFWTNRSYIKEGRERLEAVLKQGRELPTALRFKLLNGLGLYARNQGDYETARRVYEEGLAEGEAAGDLRQLVIVHHGLAALAKRQGDFTAAQEFHEKELAFSRRMNDENNIAIALASLGDLALVKGEIAKARRLIEESLAIAETRGDRQLLCTNLLNLGTVCYAEQDFRAAQAYFAKALSAAQEIGNKVLISCSLDGFAALAVAGGQAEPAARLAGAADFLRASIGYEIELTERRFRDRYLAKVRAALDDKVFDAAFEDGRAMGLSEAVKLVSRSSEFLAAPARGENLSGDFNAPVSEIIVETHRFERVIIEEEISREDAPEALSLERARRLKAPQNEKKSRGLTPVFVYSSVGIGLLAVILGFWLWRGEKNFEPEQVKFTKLTTSGKITNATLTPDGKYAVFSQVENDGESLWLRHLATGSQNQILKSQPVGFVGLTVAPDSNFIYATVFSGDFPDPQLWRIPLLGGATEQVPGVTTGAAVSFSPDGRRFAFTESRSSVRETHFGIADAGGANKRILVRAENETRAFPNFKANPVAWAPDGAAVACAVEEKNSDGSVKAGILLINPDDGSEKFISERRWDNIENVTWLDAENLALTTFSENQGQIWAVSRATGAARQLTNGAGSYSWLAAADGNLLTVQKTVVSRVSIADFDEAARKFQSRQIFEESGYIPVVNWTADGKILYGSTASGQPEIWRVDPDGGEKMQLTVNSGLSFGLSVSAADGALLFSARENGKQSLRLSDSEGRNMRRLPDVSDAVWANFTPDGQAAIFQRGLNNKTITLWRLDLRDGKLTPLTQTHATHPAVSPDGARTAYYFMDNETDNRWRIGLVSNTTGEFLGKLNLPKEATERRMRWHPGGQFISQIASRGENINLLLLPLSGSEPAQAFDLGKGDVQWFEWSKDGTKIVISQTTETQDVALVSF